MIHRTQPPPDTSSLVQAANGSRWRFAGRNADGEQLYILDGVDPGTCPHWVRASEAELIETVGALTPVTETAGEVAR
ncbi:hypothetical protein ACFXGT_11475 [Streptomyces sp. NPDC059352]|uniref:hypothetical protein n=1 Tax=Streptomyces sp. NPDC059352 TaxID=3346810 RepID=UPI0036B7EF51